MCQKSLVNEIPLFSEFPQVLQNGQNGKKVQLCVMISFVILITIMIMIIIMIMISSSSQL